MSCVDLKPLDNISDKYPIAEKLPTKIMDFETKSTNPTVKAFVAGTAPRPAQLATARASAMTILTRLQLRDLQAISKNRNVSGVVRRQSLRLYQARTGVI